MERLCDEVIQLIFYELIDPTSLTLVCKRFHRFSQDPYVRAHYFLSRYGPTEAMFYALGRGKVLTERVLDILLTSGAHLSRYLIQISMHHYFYTQAHFIKTPWVRTVRMGVFVYFLKLAEERYGEIPRGKGEDDGSLFSSFLKESRLPVQLRHVSWEVIRDILESYSDPLMSQFPLALAIEPRLLPYAVKNGFYMDSKYRDFVFRKMFERPPPSNEISPEDIAHNVRELCRLDSTMFVSRTVAAEVCMEARSNDSGYTALKQLDKSGHLLFELGNLVEDLLKTFLKTRSISSQHTIEILRYLFTDFPTSDPTARLVILVTVFVTSENLHSTTASIHGKLDALGLLPLTRRDVYNILVNPFVERYQVLLEYAKREVTARENGSKGLSAVEIRQLVEEVGAKLLEVACKGKLLKKLYDGFPSLHDSIIRLVTEKYQITVADVPSWVDGEVSRSFEGKLCQDFAKQGPLEPTGEVNDEEGKEEDQESDVEDLYDSSSLGEVEESESGVDLGSITQESLTTMIRHDEITPVRSRRRTHYLYGPFTDSSGKMQYPHDPLHVGRWIKSQFGTKSSVTAVFMTHAVINDNSSVLNNYLMYADGTQASPVSSHVPVTFKHFQILARLGRAPNFYLYHDIEFGADFYLDENDYATKDDDVRKAYDSNKVKTEIGHISPTSPLHDKFEALPLGPPQRGKKRPRRTATTVRSYAVPDSDDDAIVDGSDYMEEYEKKPKLVESSLSKWIRHLSELMKEEQRKYKDHKKRIELASEPGTKTRVMKTEFLRSVSSHLRSLRKVEETRRLKLYGPEVSVENYSDDGDDEYQHKATRSKRRRVM
ncbi:hypothetical protein BDZ94DRAFT_648521 [Collybia nuda]|uniref:F-box domain-containing protein n=1 Tax=Collybia nuda TaxID=64659 RepID=A0A9P5Y6C3_9AGAR|nr:hypothetical protein BDZ94DRAFT_648521 [Collybia nuda]